MPKKAKWGKIGAPKSKKRKAWLKTLREKKAGKAPTEKKKKASSSSKGVSYQQTWILW